jgi:hypothetical protein
LCAACYEATRHLAEPFKKMRAKLVELNEVAAEVSESRNLERFGELQALHREALQLARALDAILCSECKKLGPPCPCPEE